MRLLMTVPGVGEHCRSDLLVGGGRSWAVCLVAPGGCALRPDADQAPVGRERGDGADIEGRAMPMCAAALYEAAHVVLTRPIEGGWLKSWAMKLARRAGMRKAKVALARRLAVIMHRMWTDGTPFNHAGPVRPAMASSLMAMTTAA